MYIYNIEVICDLMPWSFSGVRPFQLHSGFLRVALFCVGEGLPLKKTSRTATVSWLKYTFFSGKSRIFNYKRGRAQKLRLGEEKKEEAHELGTPPLRLEPPLVICLLTNKHCCWQIKVTCTLTLWMSYWLSVINICYVFVSNPGMLIEHVLQSIKQEQE